MRRLDGIAVDVDDLHARHDLVDAIQRLIRHIVAVAQEDEVGFPVPRRLHEPRVHHLRTDVPHESQGRQETGDVALGEREHLPVAADRPRHQTHVDARAAIAPVAREEIPHEQNARRGLHFLASRICSCSSSAAFGVLRK